MSTEQRASIYAQSGEFESNLMDMMYMSRTTTNSSTNTTITELTQIERALYEALEQRGRTDADDEPSIKALVASCHFPLFLKHFERQQTIINDKLIANPQDKVLLKSKRVLDEVLRRNNLL